MATEVLPVLDFGDEIPVKNIEASIEERSFRDFEKVFARFVKKRGCIYSKIPGGTTWASFEPTREKVASPFCEYFRWAKEASQDQPLKGRQNIFRTISLGNHYVQDRAQRPRSPLLTS